MTNGIYTPLQINAAAGLMDNQGIVGLPTALSAAIATFNSKTVIANWLAALTYYQAQSFQTTSTLDLLLSIGSDTIPALGDSIPTTPLGSYPNLDREYFPSQSGSNTVEFYGLADLVEQTGEAYLGIFSGGQDLARFCQGFIAVQGYINNVNALINSAHNAATYLGPTFTNMANLISNNITALVNSNAALPALSVDIANQGLLVDTGNLEFYGTPAAVLAQLSKVGRIRNSTLPAIRTQLQTLGMDSASIADLVNINLQSLFKPNGLPASEFDRLQRLAYQAFGNIRGADLQDVLDILEITTPNIATMTDLLNPIVMFPNSYLTLQTPTANDPATVYQPNGSVNMNLAPVINQLLPTPSGCDELGKIIPPDQAVANKAIQSALQQITDIANTNWPTLANTIENRERLPWQPEQPYLVNDTVAQAQINANSNLAVPLAVLLPTTVTYQAIQDVPAGVNITDTSYWRPVLANGINTMSNLPDIESLASPIAAVTTAYIDSSVATGTGPDGTITTCDVLGLAIDYMDLATLFDTVSTGIQTLQDAGALAAINTAYTNIAAAVNDAAVLTQITNAETAITTLSTNPTYTATVSSINTAWTSIVDYLNQEKTYQIAAGVNYFDLSEGEQNSAMAFSRLLSQYGRDTAVCGACSFLESVADTTTLTGQAIVACLREGQNQALLAASRLAGSDIKPSVELPVAPARFVPVAN